MDIHAVIASKLVYSDTVLDHEIKKIENGNEIAYLVSGPRITGLHVHKTLPDAVQDIMTL